MRRSVACLLSSVVVLALVGCGPHPIDPLGPPLFPTGSVGGVPLETGPIVQADDPPPPISGGTLVTIPPGNVVVASDPDRDRIYVVDLGSERASLRSSIAHVP